MGEQMTLGAFGSQDRATFSVCGQYRYRLTRKWNDRPDCVFAMLNPSVADSFVDDPTIRRCIGFAKREQFGGLVIVNLFALRSPYPSVLRAHPAPVGSDNQAHLHDALADHETVIAAWGAHPFAQQQASQFVALADRLGRRLRCLGVTKHGNPRHPLYLPAETPLVPFPAVRPNDG